MGNYYGLTLVNLEGGHYVCVSYCIVAYLDLKINNNSNKLFSCFWCRIIFDVIRCYIINIFYADFCLKYSSSKLMLSLVQFVIFFVPLHCCIMFCTCACFAGSVYFKNWIFFCKKWSCCFEHSSMLHMAAQRRGSFCNFICYCDVVN